MCAAPLPDAALRDAAQPDAEPLLAGIPRARLAKFAKAEARRFARRHPLSARHMDGARPHWLGGVPMHWMRDWPMPHLAVIARARKARITSIDHVKLDDFCLGDTGAMWGHSPKPLRRAIRAQAGRGLTAMLPSAAVAEAGRLLALRFGDMRWQIATTATDANRFAIRVARAVTGRAKILVFNGCYHGTVDDVMVERVDGLTRARQGLVGQIRDLTDGAICTEFNDLAGLEAALAAGDVAAVLTEPVMTNSCMVLPAPGFHAGLRALTRQHGTLLIIDETHTLSSGPGGYTGTHGLAPDMLVVGKAVAGGMPTAIWGLTADLAERFARHDAARAPGHSGMGTTLSANPMQLACLVATLGEIMTPEAHARMEKGAARLEKGLRAAIAHHRAPWHVVRVGARVEFICAPGPLRNGIEAGLAHCPEVEAAVHVGLINRGSLIAPFHNMMLVSPVTRKAQIDRLILNFNAVLTRLFTPDAVDRGDH